jgi:hypothetical protein
MIRLEPDAFKRFQADLMQAIENGMIEEDGDEVFSFDEAYNNIMDMLENWDMIKYEDEQMLN